MILVFISLYSNPAGVISNRIDGQLKLQFHIEIYTVNVSF